MVIWIIYHTDTIGNLDTNLRGYFILCFIMVEVDETSLLSEGGRMSVRIAPFPTTKGSPRPSPAPTSLAPPSCNKERRPLEDKRGTWFWPKRWEEEFPPLAGSFRKQGKTHSVGRSLASSQLGVNRVGDESFPFERIEQGKVKIKEIPIELC